MLASLLTVASALVSEYGTWGVFILGIIEEIFLPVPSSFTLMAAGFLLLPNEAGILLALYKALVYIALPGALGLALGSFFFYTLGFFGGKPLILRFGKFFGLTWERIDRIEKKFMDSRRDELILLSLRAIPIIPNIAISAACGVVRYPWRMFFVTALLGNVIRGMIMAMLGYAVGEAYARYADYVSRVEHALLLAALIALLFYAFRHMKKKYELAKKEGPAVD